MTQDTDLIRRGDAMDLRDELADVIGARPLSSIHSALSEYRKAIRALPAASQPEAEPVVWVIPGCDTEDCNGFVDAMGYEYGEFTRPLYAHPTPAPVVPAEGLDALVKRAYRAANSCLTNDDAIIRELAGAITALRTTPPVGARVSIPSGLIDALRSQRQIDADGCEVAVSRQACDEAAAILAALLPAGEGK
jgi:hypothetical protein